jgi:hypothetical protein
MEHSPCAGRGHATNHPSRSAAGSHEATRTDPAPIDTSASSTNEGAPEVYRNDERRAPGAYPPDYWVLGVHAALWADGIHARQGTGATGWKDLSGLLIRGFRVRVPGGVPDNTAGHSSFSIFGDSSRQVYRTPRCAPQARDCSGTRYTRLLRRSDDGQPNQLRRRAGPEDPPATRRSGAPRRSDADRFGVASEGQTGCPVPSGRKREGQGGNALLAISMYTAPGGLRQDRGRAAQSTVRGQNPSDGSGELMEGHAVVIAGGGPTGLVLAGEHPFAKGR